MTIYASPLYLDDGYFVWKSSMVQRIASMVRGGICLVVSFELTRDALSERGVSRLLSLAQRFERVVIEYARNVDWGRYRDSVERSGVEIYDGPAPASATT